MTKELAETKRNDKNVLSLYGLGIGGMLIGIPAGFEYSHSLLPISIGGLIAIISSGLHIFKNLEWDREESE